MAASGNSPDLSEIEPSTTAEEGRAAGPAPSAVPPKPAVAPEALEPARRSRWLVWLLAVALVVAVLWGLSQGRYAAQLAGEVTRLEGELSTVGAELEAYRSHMESVRIGLDDVTGRMLALRDLAQLDPTAASGEDAAASEPDGSEAAVQAAPTDDPARPPASADF